MLPIGIIFAFIATASAGYASSSAGGAGLYNSNTNGGGIYGPKYPYSNQYTGFAGGSAGGFPFAPVAPFASPYDFQNAFQQYFNQLSAFNAKHLTTAFAGEGASVGARSSLGPTQYKSETIDDLYTQQLAHQAAVFDSIRNQAYGGGYGGAGNFGGAGGAGDYVGGGGGGGFGGAGAYGGATAGTYGGGSVGSYGGNVPSRGSFGGTYGGNGYAPNFASAGGAVGNGYQQQHASIYPANPASPNLDSRFGGDDSSVGVTHSQGPPGFVGVSSFSSSSDVNGVRNREAATTVNDNGKVTTYQTRS